MSSKLASSRFVIGYKIKQGPVQTVFNRYRRSSSPGNSTGGVILFLTHGGGHHKELWEPTIEDIFAVDTNERVKEAWAMDGLNHGESAVLNAEVFAKQPFAPTYECGEAWAKLIGSEHFQYYNSQTHTIFQVGHSAGAVISVLSTQYFPGPPSEIPYSGLILIEPAIISEDKVGQETQMYHIVKGMTPKRRDIWDTKDSAKEWLQKRIPWSTWDLRVLQLYVEYGLCPLPTPLYPDKTGVTLRTGKAEEARVFDCLTEALHALNRLNQIATTVPVHFIFGGREELYPKDVQDALNDPRRSRPASIARVASAGHLVVQEAPTELAKEIYNIVATQPIVSNL